MRPPRFSILNHIAVVFVEDVEGFVFVPLLRPCELSLHSEPFDLIERTTQLASTPLPLLADDIDVKLFCQIDVLWWKPLIETPFLALAFFFGHLVLAEHVKASMPWLFDFEPEYVGSFVLHNSTHSINYKVTLLSAMAASWAESSLVRSLKFIRWLRGPPAAPPVPWLSAAELGSSATNRAAPTSSDWFASQPSGSNFENFKSFCWSSLRKAPAHPSAWACFLQTCATSTDWHYPFPFEYSA